MDEQPAQDPVQKIIDGASTRALGWILEQHCKLRLNTKLEILFISDHRIARELLQEPESRSTIENIARDILGTDVDVVLRYATNMDGTSAHDVVQKIIENCSTRALGWILEQHCKLVLNTTLEIVFVGNHRLAHELLAEDDSRRVLEDISGAVVGREVDVVLLDSDTDRQPTHEIIDRILEGINKRPYGWGIAGILGASCKLTLNTRFEIVLIDDDPVTREMLEEPESKAMIQDVARTVIGRDVDVVLRFPELDAALAETSRGLNIGQAASPSRAVDNVSSHQLAEASKEQKEIAWNGLRFRSQTEVRIAQQLDRRKVLFFPNCKGRLGLRERENREPDFLVCYEGKWGILEVDGPDTHPPSRAAEDHERDRLFKQHGILLVEHFDASECWENADGVVKKFLELLRKQR